MANSYFKFKQFTVSQEKCAMKVSTDSCLFGAWVAEKLKNISIKKILDVGTGTGLLSLMLAQKNTAEILALEIDKKAAEQAYGNFAASPWAERLTVREIDFMQFTSESRFELLICNPPFYENSLHSNDEGKNLAHHDAGLQLEKLIQKVPSLMHENGHIALLLPYDRIGEAEVTLMKNNLFVEEKIIVSDKAESRAIRIMLWVGKKEKECSTEKMSIYKADRQYSTSFTDLLLPYYLYL